MNTPPERKKRKSSPSIEKGLSKKVLTAKTSELETDEIQGCFGPDGFSIETKKPPGQPMVTVVEMEPILQKLGYRTNDEWTTQEKNELAHFMCNRVGIDCRDIAATNQAGLTALFEHWFKEYVDLYSKDADFEKAIDPWMIIVIERPADDLYLPRLNEANLNLLGGDGPANASGQT